MPSASEGKNAICDAEITAQAHFLLGTRHHLDHLMSESADGRPYPGDEAVVDTYLALVRGGLEALRNGEKEA